MSHHTNGLAKTSPLTHQQYHTKYNMKNWKKLNCPVHAMHMVMFGSIKMIANTSMWGCQCGRDQERVMAIRNYFSFLLFFPKENSNFVV